jgi:hypothetical protein
MLGFAKLSNEVGIAFDAPSPEWNLKFLSMSAITAAAAAPAPAAPTPAPATSPATATSKPSETVETAKSTTPAAAPKPPANGGTSRGQQANGARGTQGGRGQNGANGRPSLLQAGGFQRVDVNTSGDGAAGTQDTGVAASEMADRVTARPVLLVSGSVSRGLDMPQQNDWFGGPGGRMDGMGGGPDGMNGMNGGLMGMNGPGG